MRLCFGTFARVLQLCKLDVVTDPRLIGTMTRTIDPQCQYIMSGNATSVHRLLSCTGNLSPGNITEGGVGAIRKPGKSISNILLMAPKANRDDLIRKFGEDVVSLLNEDKKLQAVLALLDIIEKDTVIDNDSAEGKKMSFEKYVGTTKNALLSQTEYVLSDFLASIFLYTVAAGVINTVGREVAQTITSEYISEIENSRGITIIESCPSSAQTVPSRTVLVTPAFEQEAFLTYLTNVRNKYSTIKTLLYNEQPKPFYDFYVCNNITWRTRVEGENNPFKREFVSDANIKKLTEISHFIFITGAGGLGKSMMMRHLLLNTIDNYKDFKQIPVFIPLKEFDDASGKLFDYIFSKIDVLIETKWFTIFLLRFGGIIMKTSDMVRQLCEQMNISVSELARRLGQSPQNFGKKLKRETITLEELKAIADVMDVKFEQAFILPDGNEIKTGNE